MAGRGMHSGRGQAIVEFALVAPVLFVIFVGILEMARLTFFWIALQQGAQEAARVGSLSATNTTQVVQAARNATALVGPGLTDCSTNQDIEHTTCTSPPGGGVMVGCSGEFGTAPAECAVGNRLSGGFIRVQITYPFEPVPLVYPFGTIRLYGWAQVRVE